MHDATENVEDKQYRESKAHIRTKTVMEIFWKTKE